MEPQSGFNTLDLAVLGVILVSGLLALLRGFTRELLSLFAWVGAGIAATQFYPLALPWMHHHIKHEQAAKWAASALIFVVALLILMIIGALIASLVKGKAVTSIDRSLGFVFGLGRGVLMVCALYLGAVMMFWPDIDKPPEVQQKDKDHTPAPAWLLQAKSRPVLRVGAHELMNFIPQDELDATFKQIEAQGHSAERVIDDQNLTRLSTPMPPRHLNDTTDTVPSEGSQP